MSLVDLLNTEGILFREDRYLSEGRRACASANTPSAQLVLHSESTRNA